MREGTRQREEDVAWEPGTQELEGASQAIKSNLGLRHSKHLLSSDRASFFVFLESPHAVASFNLHKGLIRTSTELVSFHLRNNCIICIIPFYRCGSTGSGKAG